MQVKSIAECSNGSILQYFRPSLGFQREHSAILSTFIRLPSVCSQTISTGIPSKALVPGLMANDTTSPESTIHWHTVKPGARSDGKWYNITWKYKRQTYSKTCVKWLLSKRPKNGYQDQLSLNKGQKYCRMLQGEHSAIRSTFIRLPSVWSSQTSSTGIPSKALVPGLMANDTASPASIIDRHTVKPV